MAVMTDDLGWWLWLCRPVVWRLAEQCRPRSPASTSPSSNQCARRRRRRHRRVHSIIAQLGPDVDAVLSEVRALSSRPSPAAVDAGGHGEGDPQGRDGGQQGRRRHRHAIGVATRGFRSRIWWSIKMKLWRGRPRHGSRRRFRCLAGGGGVLDHWRLMQKQNAKTASLAAYLGAELPAPMWRPSDGGMCGH